MLALDLSSIVPFAFTAIAVVFAFFFLVKKAAVKYFAVDETFDRNYDCCHLMSIGSNDFCAVCRKSGSKICSRCKSVRYCSQACQSKHWHADHKSECKPANSSNKINSEPVQRKKSVGFGSISLMPARGSYKKLQEPKKILFSYDEFLKLFNWNNPGFPPCGLLNCGNSCFANVVLQCLSSTRPLTAYLLEKDHSRTCTRKQEDWCFLCELQTHIQRVSQSSRPFSPTNILSRIPNIGGNLGYGSQEDAHEFMRFAIDTMQSICLDEHGGEKYLDPSTQETTLIQHIFGGHLQSQVKCTKCNTVSNRYENMMDLTVEIHGANDGSLEECLNQFTATECLDGDNKYKCDGCNDYVKAWKRLTVHQAPNILTITLKRFQTGRFGKLNKRVTFPEELDLSPYMSEDGDGTDLYSLYAVVVHVDMLNASYFGHYICYIKHCGRWYMIDDGNVKVVDVDEVLSEGAYMLLYSRRTARKKPFSMPKEASKKKIEENAIVSNDSNTDTTTTVSTKVQVSADIPSTCNEAHATADTTSTPCPDSNNDLASPSSTNNPESNTSLIRDTGHDRVTADCAGQANSDSNAPVDANASLVNENEDMIEPESVKSDASDSKKISSQDPVPVSHTCTESQDTRMAADTVTKPDSSEILVEAMEAEASLESNGQHDTEEDAVNMECDPTCEEVATHDMECDETFSISDSNHNEDNKINGDCEMEPEAVKLNRKSVNGYDTYDTWRQNYPEENGCTEQKTAVLSPEKWNGHAIANSKSEPNGYKETEPLRSPSLNGSILLSDSGMTDINNGCKTNGIGKEMCFKGLNGNGLDSSQRERTNGLVSSE